MNFDDLYRDVILDHHRHPRGTDPIDHPHASFFGVNPTCGDEVTVKLEIDRDKVVAIQVEASGCAISTAAGSMIAEAAVGKSFDQFQDLTESLKQMLRTGDPLDDPNLGDLDALIGVHQFPVRVKCATLAVTTALQAFKIYMKKHPSEARRELTIEAG